MGHNCSLYHHYCKSCQGMTQIKKTLTGLTPPYFTAYLKSGPRFPSAYVVFLVFKDLR